MPRSRRSKITTLSKTPFRSTKASKQALVNEIRAQVDKYDHVWVFSVGDMRNEGLKEVRSQWRGTGRFFFGKGKVMAKALGETAETEYQEGLSELAKRLRGQIGLFFTSHPVDETVEWFDSWTKKEYARMGARATEDITLPEGPLLTPYNESGSGDPFPHSMEPQLRALGLSTSLVRGVPSLNNPHVLCRKGEKLSSEKCRILKLLAVQMAEFRIHLGSRWTKGTGYVAGKELDQDESDAEKEVGMDED
ncbi:mRNA turnover protein 4 [Kwoniella heveanensis BCC8398]|uniref:Ribosome assembly factor mrt4 n=1 Tax=Kwoniella heveanensis BCC8398 TaxID=1296120 RepID=A0A1B9GWT8_9TREE|nr:mRNA turnover protein 4 [Kwoniella heveanensis BCC8398]